MPRAKAISDFSQYKINVKYGDKPLTADDPVFLRIVKKAMQNRNQSPLIDGMPIKKELPVPGNEK